VHVDWVAVAIQHVGNPIECFGAARCGIGGQVHAEQFRAHQGTIAVLIDSQQRKEGGWWLV
jgi:hypothetical protein